MMVSMHRKAGLNVPFHLLAEKLEITRIERITANYPHVWQVQEKTLPSRGTILFSHLFER